MERMLVVMGIPEEGETVALSETGLVYQADGPILRPLYSVNLRYVSPDQWRRMMERQGYESLDTPERPWTRLND